MNARRQAAQPTRRRRARSTSGITTIYWRDIPAQIVGTSGEHTCKRMLAQRFQIAVDRAAKVAGLTERHDYIAQWRRDAAPLPNELSADVLAETVDEHVARLDDMYDRETLAALVRQGGVNTSGDTA